MPEKIIFQKIEGGKAYLKNEKEEDIIIPESLLGKKCRKGDVLYIALSEKDTLAKDIINEILDT